MKWKNLEDPDLKDYHKVLVLTIDGFITTGCRDSSGFWQKWDVSDGYVHLIDNVIRWMPLPLIPKYLKIGMK